MGLLKGEMITRQRSIAMISRMPMDTDVKDFEVVYKTYEYSIQYRFGKRYEMLIDI